MMATDGRSIAGIVCGVANADLLEFSERKKPLGWLETSIIPGRKAMSCSPSCRPTLSGSKPC